MHVLKGNAGIIIGMTDYAILLANNNTTLPMSRYLGYHNTLLNHTPLILTLIRWEEDSE